MNIAVYTSNSVFQNKSVGGAEHSLKSLWLFLNKEGQRTTYITDSQSRLQFKAKSELSMGYPIIFLPSINLPFQRLTFLKNLNNRLQQLLKQKALREILKDTDLVHTYNEIPDTFLIQKVRYKYQLRFKICIRVAGLYWHKTLGLRDNTTKRLVENVYSGVDSANFISDGLKTMFYDIVKNHHYEINLKHHKVLDIGVNLDSNTPKWLPKQDGVFRIVMVGRFTETQKRQDILISAFSMLGKENSLLIFYGDGPTKKGLQQYCKSNQFLKGRVKFEGYKSRQEVLSALTSSDLFCLCTDYEGLCKSIIEALSLGVPVLASDVAAPNTYLDHNQTGFLMENEPMAWSNEINRIIGMAKEEKKAVAQKGFEFASMHYSASKNIKEYQKYFAEVLKIS